MYISYFPTMLVKKLTNTLDSSSGAILYIFRLLITFLFDHKKKYIFIYIYIYIYIYIFTRILGNILFYPVYLMTFHENRIYSIIYYYI